MRRCSCFASNLLPLPTHCPVFGFRLHYRSKKRFDPRSASVDRINQCKGYTKRNIIIVSLRANLIKGNANPTELQAVANFYSKLASVPRTS
jgi:hypothetical protein